METELDVWLWQLYSTGNKKKIIIIKKTHIWGRSKRIKVAPTDRCDKTTKHNHPFFLFCFFNSLRDYLQQILWITLQWPFTFFLSLILSMYKFYHTYSVFFFRVCTRRAKKKKIKSTAILLLRLRKLTIFLFLFLLVYDILRSSVKEGNLYGGN